MELNDYCSITNEQEERFKKYESLLIEWNKKMNLTAITEHDEVILKHFVDSISILKYINNDCKIIDVGTGAGFPGIPIKIMNESVDVTLMDSLNKRINFLNEVITDLELKRIKAVHARAEDLARNAEYREQFDFATSRAVANLRTLLEYMLPFVKVGGYCICMKGPNVEEEIKMASKALKVLGGRIEKVDNLILPDSNIERNIIVIRKINKINLKYPRKAGVPAKDPI